MIYIVIIHHLYSSSLLRHPLSSRTMNTKDIQQLIDFISQSGLDEVNIETTDLKISVKRYGAGAPAAIPATAAPVAQSPVAQPQAVAVPAAPVAVPAAAPQSRYVKLHHDQIADDRNILPLG